MWALATLLVVSSFAGAARAAAITGRGSNSPPTPVAQSTVNALIPMAHFAAAAYCQPSALINWSCSACNSVPDMIPTAAGGDGSTTQIWYVGYYQPLSAVVVAHEGTNTSALDPLLEDADAVLGSLDSSLFPGVPSSVEVHDGFASAQAKTAPSILAAVQQTMSSFSTSHIILASHSLGAAITVLDAIYLKIHIPSATFQVANFGQPRIGNQDFANYVDANFGGVLTHTSNKKDIVPILPGRFLGYHHPSGEIHIQEATGNVVSCAGQDDTASGCTISDTPNIFEASVSDHDGPYFGVTLGGGGCSP